jgi:hypothetical protein
MSGSLFTPPVLQSDGGLFPSFDPLDPLELLAPPEPLAPLDPLDPLVPPDAPLLAPSFVLPFGTACVPGGQSGVALPARTRTLFGLGPASSSGTHV